MYKKRVDIVQGVIKKIGLVNGTAVQTYTEPQVQTAVQDAFYMVFRKRYWEHLSDWYTYALDGVNGFVTADLTNIVKSIEDIREIWGGTTFRQRLTAPLDIQGEIVTGSAALYYKPVQFKDTVNFTTKVIKFLPATATGSVRFYARTCPNEFIDTDIVPMQADMMEWAGAWLMLETDGMNPGNANKANNMFQIAYNDIVTSLNDGVIGMGGRPYVNTVW